MLSVASDMNVQRDDDVLVKPSFGVVERYGTAVRLSPMQMELFTLLCKRAGKVVRRDAAMDFLYQLRNEEPTAKVIDVMIHKMRKRLSPLNIFIETSWGYGWSLCLRPSQITVEDERGGVDHGEI